MVSLQFHICALAMTGILCTGVVSSAEEKKLSRSDRRFLERDVAALITDAEIEIFKELGSKEDRKRFKELFWLRRDPDLMTPKNELREEYEKREKFANRFFGQRNGIRGSDTGMGRVYLLLGSPASPEERRREESGSEVFANRRLPSATDTPIGALPEFSGAELTFSIQHTRTWVYKPNPHVGLPEGLTIEFEAQQAFGMQIRQPEKIIGALERVKESYVFQPGIDYARDSRGRLKALPIRFDPRSPAKRALRELLEKDVERTDIEFEAEMTFFRSTEGAYIPVRFEIAPERLSWNDAVTEVTLFGAIETMDSRTLYRFEEPAKLSRFDSGPSVFDLPVQLMPGSYTFNLGILDNESGRVGTRRVPVFVRSFDETTLDMSSVLLYTESSEVDEQPGMPGRSFQFGLVHFTPARGNKFTPADTIGILFFVYGFGLDLQDQPDLTSDYVLFKDEEKLNEVPVQPLPANETQAIARLELPLEKFSPGKYRIEIKVTDQVANEVITDHVEFLLEPELYPVGEYSDLVDSYQKGEFLEAAEALSRAPKESLERAARDYRRGSPGEQKLKAAALLHTEVAFLTRTDVLFHLESARDYLNRIEESFLRENLLRRWYVAVSTLLRGSTQSWAALHLVQDALKMFPEDLEILLAVGSVYDTAAWMGIPSMFERAEILYREILDNHPENDEVHLRLGRLMQLKGDGEEALRELKWSVQHAADAESRFVAHMLLGETYGQLRRIQEATRSYRAALEIDPHCQAAALGLSHALHRAGDREGSREVIRHFLAQKPSPPGEPDQWIRFLFGRPELLDSAMQETRKEFLQ